MVSSNVSTNQSTQANTNTQSVPTQTAVQTATEVNRTQPQPVNQSSAATPNPNSPSKASSHLSILRFKQKNEEEKKENMNEDAYKQIAENNNFTQEQMIAAWNKYIRSIQGKHILQNTMESCKPTLTNDFILVQSVDNSFQEKEMRNEMVPLLNFLRSELKNGQITLDIRLSEMTGISKAMTPNERLKRMIDNNPSINILREQFKLEIDLG